MEDRRRVRFDPIFDHSYSEVSRKTENNWGEMELLKHLETLDTGHPRDEPGPGEAAAAGLPLLVPGPPRVRGLHPPPAGARQPPVPAGQPGHRAAAGQRRARHRHCLLQTGQGGEEECTTIIY